MAANNAAPAHPALAAFVHPCTAYLAAMGRSYNMVKQIRMR